MSARSFWEDPEVVARFATRAADHRLVQLIQAQDVRHWRVLDVGCAAGRNTVYLAERGFEVIALDASQAMVAKTRERLQGLLPEAEVARRVLWGRMEDLPFPGASFDLVIALGVYQDAPSFALWRQALGESARVLKPGGLCLVAQFAPDHQPHGKQARPVPGEAHVFVGASRDDNRRLTLLTAAELDGYAAQYHLHPVVPTEQVRRDTQAGYRSTVNALYRKRAESRAENAAVSEGGARP
jgi:SAM-dependent methyltransferase